MGEQAYLKRLLEMKAPFSDVMMLQPLDEVWDTGQWAAAADEGSELEAWRRAGSWSCIIRRMSLPAARTSWHRIAMVAALVAGGSSGCDGTPRALDWHFRFASAELAERAAVVEAAIERGGCGTGDLVYAAPVRRGEPVVEPGILEPGEYGLRGRAGDASCTWFAAGCVERTLPLDGGEVVEILLEAVAEVAFCEGGLCLEGRCSTDEQGADGGDPPEGDGEAGRDGGDPEPGPLTLVVTAASFSTDRICDHDGDGVGDNAIADLGSPGAELFARIVSLVVHDDVAVDGPRQILSIPWVDDLRGPTGDDLRMAFVDGVDTDDPANRDDDFSGSEPFYAAGESVDACGEPRFAYRRAQLEAGSLDTDDDVSVFQIDQILGRGARVLGSIEPFGRGAELQQCAYSLIADLGASTEQGAARSFLELLLAGGAAAGMPEVPGLRPDIDLDGDGLERLVLDADGQIVSCVDGDSTTIEGRDCWADPRMADAFSLVVDITATGAELAGLEPGWENHAQGSCAGAHHCRLLCLGDTVCGCDPVCADGEPFLAAVDDCAAELCSAPCVTDVNRNACRACLDEECDEALAACDAFDCCPSPPEPSFWEPS